MQLEIWPAIIHRQFFIRIEEKNKESITYINSNTSNENKILNSVNKTTQNDAFKMNKIQTLRAAIISPYKIK